MPYPSEHAARVKDPGSCDSFKRMNQGSGVSLILCIKDGKSSAQAYRFKKDKFTAEQAKAWLAKHDIKYISFEKASEGKDMNAKLSVKASNGQPEIDGRIWSAGMHHVFVNDKPAKVYVPEETIMDTFNSVRKLINDQGRMPIGIDHLSDSILEDNEILAKMNLLDVGSVSKVGTDGQSIYILDSELTNDQIRELNSLGELPSYSIVGGMDAKPCPTGQADYVVNSIDVERVDIVQEGGCQVCKVGAQPDNLILTSKKSMEEYDMVNANEAPVQEKEEVVEEVAEEVPVEEAVEEPVAEPVAEEEVVEEVEEVEVEEQPSEMDALREEIKALQDEIKNLGGKKPKVSAKDAEAAVTELIKAGKALPKMKAGLMKTYEADPEAFAELAASMPKMVQMKAQAKLAKKAKKDEEEQQKKAQDDAMKAQLEDIFRVKL